MLHIVGTCDKRLFGMTPAERLRRQRGDAPGPVLVAEASAVLSDPAVEWLLENPGRALATPAGRAVAVAADGSGTASAEAALQGAAGSDVVNPATMPKLFVRKLRRRDQPLVRSLEEQPAHALERELFDTVYKGITDVVTKYAWPVPAYWATRFCTRFGVRPNAVTLTGMAMMVIAAVLWFRAELWVGLLFAWTMTFLDTVDGKLARVTVTSSELGNRLDHVTDIVHPPIWWACLAFGLAEHAPDQTPAIETACAVILVSYVAGRVVEELFRHRIGYNAYLWRPFDSGFRLIVARRNIILLLMTIGMALGAPVEAFVACAVWSALSVIIQLVRFAQALRAARAGPTPSWLM